MDSKEKYVIENIFCSLQNAEDVYLEKGKKIIKDKIGSDFDEDVDKYVSEMLLNLPTIPTIPAKNKSRGIQKIIFCLSTIAASFPIQFISVVGLIAISCKSISADKPISFMQEHETPNSKHIPAGKKNVNHSNGGEAFDTNYLLASTDKENDCFHYILRGKIKARIS